MRAFDYARVDDPASAVNAASTASQYLAGGTTLLDLMKLDVMQPTNVIDVNALSRDFGAIETGPAGLRLGAFVHMAEAADHPAIRRDFPVIAQSLQLAASAQIRNMATLGGNVLQRTRCTYFRDTSWGACSKRNPGSGCAAIGGINRKHAVLGTSDACIAAYAGDFAQALIALDATVDIVGPQGPRTTPFAQLHVEPKQTPNVETVLKPGDLIVGFSIPAKPWFRRSLYLKVRDRESYEFALASAAVALDMDGGKVREARIALGGVATKPWRTPEAEAMLAGRQLNEKTAARAASVAFASAITHGENDYKPELGRRTLVRALLQAAGMEV